MSYLNHELELEGFFLKETEYGIFKIICKDIILTENLLVELFDNIFRIKSQAKFGLLIDLRSAKMVSPEAVLLIKQKAPDLLWGIALLAQTDISIMVANYLLYALKPNFPMQIFSDFESAHHWILDLKSSQVGENDQIESIYKTLLGIAQSDASQQAIILDGDSTLDAIASGLNMLSAQINDQHKEKEQLAEKIKDYEHFFNQSSDYFFIANAEGCFEATNLNFEKALGYLPNELLNKRCYDYIHSDDIASTAFELEKLKNGIQSVGLKNRILKKDGTYSYCEWKVIPNRHTGKLYAISNAGELTPPKIDQFPKSKENIDFKRALNEANIVSITDRTGIVSYVNDAFCEISKYSREELIGLEHIELNSKYISKELSRNLWITISYGKVWKGELLHKNKVGEFYWLDTVIVPFFDEHSVPVQYIVISTDITKRKKAEESHIYSSHASAPFVELNSKEDLLKNAIEELSVGVQIIGFDWIYIYSNDAFAKQMKTTKEELMFQSMVEKLPGIEFTQTFQSCISCFEFRKPEYLEDQFYFPDGSTQRLSLRIEPIEEGIFVISEYANEKYKSSVDSPLSAFVHNGILNTLPAQIGLVNGYGVLMSANDHWKNFYLKHGQHALCRIPIGANLLDVYYEEAVTGNEYAHKAFNGIKLVLEKKQVSFKLAYPSYEYGLEKWYQLQVIRFEDESPMAIISHVDISDIMRDKSKIAYSEQKYRNLFEECPVALLNMDLLTGDIIDLNTKSLSLFAAHSKLELLNLLNPFSNYLNDFKQNDFEGINTELNPLNESEIELVKMDGTVFQARIIKNENPEKSITQLAIIDISSHNLKENELAEQVNQLSLKNKNLEQFNYIVSHNFRTNVANIIGLSNMLKDGIDSMELQKQTLEMLSLSATKLDEAIKDLGKILYTKEQVKDKTENIILSDLMEDVEDSIRPLIIETGAVINSDFSRVNEIMSIRAFITSIFYNLIVNAIKHSNPEVKPIIFIASESIENKVIFKFRDNGIGFNLEKDGANIYKPYKRFKTKSEGKGLGLYMVKIQVELLGGSIHLNSELGKGSEFIIELNNTNITKHENKLKTKIHSS